MVKETIGVSVVIRQQGFIRNLTITPRENKDDMYKFQIEYIDSEDNLQEPSDWYSGFKVAPAQDGDYIIFNYKVYGKYNTIKEVLHVKLSQDNINIGGLIKSGT